MVLHAEKHQILRSVPDSVRLGKVGLAAFQTKKEATVSAAELLGNPSITLHSLELDKGVAVFVETERNANLEKRPFYDVAQRAQARRLYTVSLADLSVLANNYGTRFQNLVSIYSTGRAGSTLVSKMFRHTGGLSLSEPAPFHQLAFSALDSTERIALLQAVTRLLFKSTGSESLQDTLVIKYPGYCIGLASDMRQAFPDERAVWLYRNAYDVIRSDIAVWCQFPNKRWWFDLAPQFLRVLPWTVRHVVKPRVDEYRMALPCIAEIWQQHWAKHGTLGMATMLWAAKMESCMNHRNDGIGFTSFRYEDLLRSPKKILRSLFDRMLIPDSERIAADAALEIEHGDSQAGTIISKSRQRNWKMTTTRRGIVDRLLSGEKIVKEAGFTVPGTLNP